MVNYLRILFFAEDGVVKKEDILGVKKMYVDPVSIGGGNKNAFSIDKLLVG